MSETPGFALIAEGNLIRSSAVAINPQYDVIAAISAQNKDIFIVELSKFQRRWVSPMSGSDRHPTCLTWRFDGRVLAAGYSDGSVALLDAENGDVLHQLSTVISKEDAGRNSSSESACILSLSWMKKVGSTPPSEQALPTYTDLLPPLRSYPKPGTNASVSTPANATISAFFQSSFLTPSSEKPGSASVLSSASPLARGKDESISLLVIEDEEGGVHLSVDGVFYLGRVALPAELRDQPIDEPDPTVPSLHLSLCSPDITPLRSPSLHGAHFSADLSRLHLVLSATVIDASIPFSSISSSFPTSSTRPRLVHLATFPSPHLSRNPRLLSRLTVAYVSFRRIGEYLAEGMKAIEKEYTITKAMMGRWRNRLAEKLGASGDPTDGPTSLLLFLGAGMCSSAVEDWLVGEIGSDGLRAWEKTLDTALGLIGTICLDHLVPAVERVIATMADLVGVAECAPTYDPPLAMDATRARSCARTASQLAGRLTMLAREADEVRKGLTEFAKWCKWAIVLCQNVDTTEAPPNNCDHRIVDQFISGPFASDYLAPYFKLTTATVTAPSLLFPHLPSVKNAWDLDPLGSTDTIRMLYERTMTDCEHLFRQPAVEVIKAMGVGRCVVADEMEEGATEVKAVIHGETEVIVEGYVGYTYFILFGGHSEIGMESLTLKITRLFSDELTPTDANTSQNAPLEFASLDLLPALRASFPDISTADTSLRVLAVSGVTDSQIAVVVEVAQPVRVSGILLFLDIGPLTYVEVNRLCGTAAKGFPNARFLPIITPPVRLLTRIQRTPPADRILVVVSSLDGRTLHMEALDGVNGDIEDGMAGADDEGRERMVESADDDPDVSGLADDFDN
ncbi:Anaphase-promoting complex subunit 4 [Gonapodya sp. JEL0774]|nr:Anaphase-promoting complex subunit 4 [Gonapodya sp. JEL0774]